MLASKKFNSFFLEKQSSEAHLKAKNITKIKKFVRFLKLFDAVGEYLVRYIGEESLLLE